MVGTEQYPGNTMLEAIDGSAIADEAAEYLNNVDAAYVSMLRRVVAARNMARHALTHNSLPADWMPTPQDLYALNDPIAERMANYLDSAERIASYRRDLGATALKKEQTLPFNLMLDFLGADGFNDPRALHEIVGNVVGGGIAKMPPGYGKTVLMVLSAVAMGIGERPSNNPEKRPKRALILVPTKRIQAQTKGKTIDQTGGEPEETPDKAPTKEFLEGFAGFAPHLKVAKFNRKTHTKSPNDCDIMTYHMFVRATEEGLITTDDYDIVFADEGHHLMGPQARATLKKFCDNRLQVMALTATTKYSSTRQLGEVLKNSICNLDFREEIEAGHLPPLQLLRVIAKGKGIKVKRRNAEDYAPEELAALAHDEERNDQVLEWVQHFVGEGKKVMVPTIAGDNCWHARHLAEQLADPEKNIQIYDPKIDAYRPIRAAVVGSFLGEKSDKILKEWDEGKYDVIFTVKAVNEGWNSVVDVVVDAAPTSSELVMEQRLGRLSRPRFNKAGEMMIKIYLTITDVVRGDKTQVTPWHILREDKINPSQIIGKRPQPKPNDRPPRNKPRPDNQATDPSPESSTPSPNMDWPSFGATNTQESQHNPSTEPAPEDGGIVVDNLPSNLAEQLGPRFMLVEDAFIGHMADRYKAPEPGWVPLADHPELWHSMSFGGLRDLLERNQLPPIIAHDKRGPMLHISPDAVIFLSNYELPPLAPLGFYAIFETAEILGVSTKTVTSIASKLAITTEDYRTRRQHVVRPHFTPWDINRMRDHLIEKATWQPGDEAISDIADEYGLTVSSIQYRLTKADPPITPAEKTMPSGQAGLIISGTEAAMIRKDLDDTLVTEANGRVTIPEMIRRSGKSRTYILSRIKANELQSAPRMGRYRDPETGHFKSARFLEAEDAKLVLTSETWIDMVDVLSTLSCSPETFRALFAMHPPAAGHRRLSKDGTRAQLSSLHTTAVDQLKAYCDRLPHHQEWTPQEVLCNNLNIPYESFFDRARKEALLRTDDRQIRRTNGQKYAIDIVYSPSATKRVLAHFNN